MEVGVYGGGISSSSRDLQIGAKENEAEMSEPDYLFGAGGNTFLKYAFKTKEPSGNNAPIACKSYWCKTGRW